MQQSASIQEHAPADHDHRTLPDGSATGAPRLRTVTGNPFPRKCSCGCGREIPRDPAIRYVVDFGASKPYPTYLREHSPDFGTYRGGRSARSRADAGAPPIPGFVPASALLPKSTSPENGSPLSPAPNTQSANPAHAEADASPSPQAGRPWASGQLVFNAGSFESARTAFADYAKDGETAQQLRTRVNRVILEDLEAKVLALRALHEKLRDVTAGPSLGDVVARGRPA
jgi:hypothetical protein